MMSIALCVIGTTMLLCFPTTPLASPLGYSRAIQPRPMSKSGPFSKSLILVFYCPTNLIWALFPEVALFFPPIFNPWPGPTKITCLLPSPACNSPNTLASLLKVWFGLGRISALPTAQAFPLLTLTPLAHWVFVQSFQYTILFPSTVFHIGSSGSWITST